MAVSPLRALTAAHFQGTWNRLRRRSGIAGLAGNILLLSWLAIVLTLPAIGLLVLGYAVGRSYGGPDASMTLPLAALGLSLYTFFSGLMGGFSSGSRQLPWETLRAFPVHAFTLFGAELVAGAAELITFVELSFLGSFCVGLGVSAPRSLPMVLLLFLSHGLMLLSLQQLFGSIAQHLARRYRAVMLLLPVAAIVIPLLLPQLVEQFQLSTLSDWAARLDPLTAWLPARFLLEASSSLDQGYFPAGPLLLAILLPTLLAALITLGAWAFVSTERTTLPDESTTQTEGMWSFQRPMFGIARLQWQSLARSIPGRFGLLMPLFTIILIRGPLATLTSSQQWSMAIAFYYASIAGANVLFNQFGLDRHGVKVLFLLPIEPLEILKGKLLGLAAWQGMQALILAGLLFLSGYRDPLAMLNGLLLYAIAFVLQAMVGQFTSIWQPNPLKTNGLRAARPPVPVLALMFGTLICSGIGMRVTLSLVKIFAPGWDPPVLLAIFLVLSGIFWPVMHFHAGYLRRNQERLVEVLGSAG